MKIKTYAVNCNDAWLNTEGDDISRSYVKYKDHQEVVSALEAKCAALAAENAGLNFYLRNGPVIRKGGELVAAHQFAPETPATDAYMSERGE